MTFILELKPFFVLQRIHTGEKAVRCDVSHNFVYAIPIKIQVNLNYFILLNRFVTKSSYTVAI